MKVLLTLGMEDHLHLVSNSLYEVVKHVSTRGKQRSGRVIHLT